MNKEKMEKVLDTLKMLTGHYWIADAEKALLSEAIQILQDATAQPVQPAVSDAEVKAAMEGMHFTSTGIPRVIDMRRALEEFAKSRTVAQPVQLDTKLLDYINCNYSDAKGETLMEKVIDALETMDIALGMTEVNQAQPVQPKEEKNSEISGLIKQVRAYKTLTQSLEYRIATSHANQGKWQEALTTLASERKANAILTGEIDALRAAITVSGA